MKREEKRGSSGCKVDFKILKSAVETAVNFFTQQCPDINPEGKTGAVLLFEDPRGVEYIDTVGTLADGASCLLAHITSAKMKTTQLRQHITHITSFQSTTSENGIDATGINLFCNGKVALSGLPELACEACLMYGLAMCDLVTDKFITRALAVSQNVSLYKRIHKGLQT